MPPLASVQQHPIVDTILGLTGRAQGLGEEVPQKVVVGGLGESELPDIVEVDGEFLCVGANASPASVENWIQ